MKNEEFVIGKLKEEEFSRLFNNSTASTKDEDIYEHWDLSVKVKIDVKSLKKQTRSDITYTETFHWVELKNVEGKLSWLYGEADYFAFETEDYWIIVEKERLQDFIKHKCVDKKVGKSKDPYELYQRANRKDVIVKVKTIDLMVISTKILNKNVHYSNE